MGMTLFAGAWEYMLTLAPRFSFAFGPAAGVGWAEVITTAAVEHVDPAGETAPDLPEILPRTYFTDRFKSAAAGERSGQAGCIKNVGADVKVAGLIHGRITSALVLPP